MADGRVHNGFASSFSMQSPAFPASLLMHTCAN